MPPPHRATDAGLPSTGTPHGSRSRLTPWIDRPARDTPMVIAWIAAPIAFYFYLLAKFWFDAPILDDYETILGSIARLRAAGTAEAWLRELFALHNEHRIVVMRLVALGTDSLLGHTDFRLLMAIGNLTVIGLFALFWAEFRDDASAAVLGAASFLLFQWSYSEAILMASAALPNIGVVFFSFATIFFAGRSTAGTLVASIACGALAAGSQSNGVFALPLAALACFLGGHRSRAAILFVAAAVLWAVFFATYVPPSNHPSVLAALSSPGVAVQLFLVIIGGIAPTVPTALLAGAAMLIAGAALWRRGFWQAHPVATCWVLFVLASAAAATAGRTGFGVFHASRYAIYSTCLVVIGFLGWHWASRPWRPATVLAACLACGAISLAITFVNRVEIAERAFRGRQLVGVASPGETHPSQYLGIQFPYHPQAIDRLTEAERAGIYRPRMRLLALPSVRGAASLPSTSRTSGHLDSVTPNGRQVTVAGWTDVSAMISRTFTVAPAPVDGALRFDAIVVRDDVARQSGNEELVHAGFRIVIDYATEQDARQAAGSLCVTVSAPGIPDTLVFRPNVSCPPDARRP